MTLIATLQQRLKELRKERKLSQKDVAAAVGAKRSTVASWEAGTRTPELEKVKRAASYFGVSVAYLLGESEVRKAPQEVYMESKVVPVPVYGEIKAGSPALAEQEILGYEWIEKSRLGSGEHFCLKVRGDSMVDAHIPDGSLVIVRKQPVVDHRDIAVVWVKEEGATVKRIRFVDGLIMLQPENPAYEPQILKPEEVIVLGKVVECRIKF